LRLGQSWAIELVSFWVQHSLFFQPQGWLSARGHHKLHERGNCYLNANFDNHSVVI
jgi:hypothetical protein